MDGSEFQAPGRIRLTPSLPTEKSGIWADVDFLSVAEQLYIEELKETRMAKNRPTQRHVHKPDDGVPLTDFQPVGQTQRNLRVAIGNRRRADGPGFAGLCVGQINAQLVGRQRGKIVSSVPQSRLQSRSREPVGPEMRIGTMGRCRTVACASAGMGRVVRRAR